MKTTKKVLTWMDFPKYQPNLGEEIIVAYNSSKEGRLIKKELIEWDFKAMNNSINNKAKFKWLMLPALQEDKTK